MHSWKISIYYTDVNVCVYINVFINIYCNFYRICIEVWSFLPRYEIIVYSSFCSSLVVCMYVCNSLSYVVHVIIVPASLLRSLIRHLLVM